MNQNRFWVWLLAIAAAASACDSDVPSGTVIAAGGVDDPTQVDAILQTARGATVVIHHAGTGRAATIWEDGAWVKHDIYQGGAGPSFTVSQIEGRPTVLATAVFPNEIPHPLLRWWTQQEDGSFVLGGTFHSGSTGESYMIGRSRYTSGDGVLLAAGWALGGLTLDAYEHVDGGSWGFQGVWVAPRNPWFAFPAGVGRLSDGSAIIASRGTGLWLHRRTDGWAPYRELAPGTFAYAQVEFPPETATNRAAALAVYTDPSTQRPRGMFVSVDDGSPSGDVDLLPDAIAALDAQIVYEPDGESGRILLWDKDQGLPYLVRFARMAFEPAEELRPDLVFDGIPRLLRHSSGGFLILHVSRSPAEAAGSRPAVLESLVDFAR